MIKKGIGFVIKERQKRRYPVIYDHKVNSTGHEDEMVGRGYSGNSPAQLNSPKNRYKYYLHVPPELYL